MANSKAGARLGRVNRQSIQIEEEFWEERERRKREQKKKDVRDSHPVTQSTTEQEGK